MYSYVELDIGRLILLLVCQIYLMAYSEHLEITEWFIIDPLLKRKVSFVYREYTKRHG